MQNEFHDVWIWAKDLHIPKRITSYLSFSQSLSFIINNKLQVTNNIWLSVVSFGSLCPVAQTCTGEKSSLEASFCGPWSVFVCMGLSWGLLDSPSGWSLGDLFKHGVKTKETPYIKDAFPVCVWVDIIPNILSQQHPAAFCLWTKMDTNSEWSLHKGPCGLRLVWAVWKWPFTDIRSYYRWSWGSIPLFAPKLCSILTCFTYWNDTNN